MPPIRPEEVLSLPGELLPADWAERYERWIAAARPLLENREFRPALADYPWPTFEDSPLTPLRTPVERARLALVSSGGLSLPGQAPFAEEDPEGDTSFRVVTDPGPLAAWQIHHGHYDPAAAREDYNAVFPLDVLQGLASQGEIGSVAPGKISFMGYQTNAAAWVHGSLPAIAERLRADGADAALLVPV